MFLCFLTNNQLVNIVLTIEIKQVKQTTDSNPFVFQIRFLKKVSFIKVNLAKKQAEQTIEAYNIGRKLLKIRKKGKDTKRKERC